MAGRDCKPSQTVPALRLVHPLGQPWHGMRHSRSPPHLPQGNFEFTGARIVTRWLPAASGVGAAALAASPTEDALLPLLREDGLRGALWQGAAHEPPEARTTLTQVSRAHLDAAFHQVRGPWSAVGVPLRAGQQRRALEQAAPAVLLPAALQHSLPPS